MHKPHARRALGFTLIELLIVMVILGLLAAIVVPKLFGKVDGAKLDATRTQLTALETALDAFRLDIGRYPTTEEGLLLLQTAPAEDTPGANRWRGPYLKKTPRDAWGNVFQYRAPGEHGDFDLWSNGADNKEGGEGNDADLTNWEAGSDTDKAQ